MLSVAPSAFFSLPGSVEGGGVSIYIYIYIYTYIYMYTHICIICFKVVLSAFSVKGLTKTKMKVSGVWYSFRPRPGNHSTCGTGSCLVSGFWGVRFTAFLLTSSTPHHANPPPPPPNPLNCSHEDLIGDSVLVFRFLP